MFLKPTTRPAECQMIQPEDKFTPVNVINQNNFAASICQNQLNKLPLMDQMLSILWNGSLHFCDQHLFAISKNDHGGLRWRNERAAIFFGGQSWMGIWYRVQGSPVHHLQLYSHGSLILEAWFYQFQCGTWINSCCTRPPDLKRSQGPKLRKFIIWPSVSCGDVQNAKRS